MFKKRFVNKVVLITGGAQGIGKNITRAFGEENAIVIISDINKEKGMQTKTEFIKSGINCDFIWIDLSKKNAALQLIEKIKRKYNRLDIVINNARSGKRIDFFKENDESWEDGIAVTLRVAFFISQEAIKLMKNQNFGCIVNISSVIANLVSSDAAIYHISKAGIQQMTRYLALQAGKYNIRVNDVMPGKIVRNEDRERFEREDNKTYKNAVLYCQSLKRIGTPDDIAKAVLFLASDDASFITGQSIVVDGGLSLSEQSNLVLAYAKDNKIIH